MAAGLQRISLCGCVPLCFCAPCVGASVGVPLPVRSSGVDISFMPGSPGCCSADLPGGRSAAASAFSLQQPPPDGVREEETPCGGRCKPQWGF